MELNKNKFNLLVILCISSILFCSCNNATNNNQNPNDTCCTTTKSINSFLFLKSNMKSNEIIRYLDSAGISHSKLTILKDLNNKESTFIEIYNLTVVDVSLDTSTIVFYKDCLSSFIFSHNMTYTNNFWTKKAENGVDALKKPKALIIYENKLAYCDDQLDLFYNGLNAKYGPPKITNNSESLNWEDFHYGKGSNIFEVTWQDKNNLVNIKLTKVLNREEKDSNTEEEGEIKSFGYNIFVEFNSKELSKIKNDVIEKKIIKNEAEKIKIEARAKRFQDVL